jgi:hypothetical protein
MNRMITKSLALVALVGAITAFSTSKAEATLVAYICDDAACSGGGDFIASDGSGSDANPLGGVINFTAPGVIGSYEVLINVAQRTGGGLDLNYTVSNIAGGGAPGTVWLWAVDDFFPGPALIHGGLGGTDNNSASVTAFICGGSSNVMAAPNAGPCDSATDTLTSGPLKNLTAITLDHAASANPYAYSIGVMISGVAVGTTTTGDFGASVPEPVSLSLLGLGLAGYAVRRRRQQA